MLGGERVRSDSFTSDAGQPSGLMSASASVTGGDGTGEHPAITPSSRAGIGAAAFGSPRNSTATGKGFDASSIAGSVDDMDGEEPRLETPGGGDDSGEAVEARALQSALDQGTADDDDNRGYRRMKDRREVPMRAVEPPPPPAVAARIF